MTKKPDLLSTAERSVKALLLKSKDASLDEQVDTIRAVTAFLMVKHRIAPDKEDDDWLSDAQRKLRRDTSGGDADTPKPNGATTQRRTSRDAYLAASKAADAANGSSNASLLTLPATAVGPPVPITDDEDNDAED